MAAAARTFVEQFDGPASEEHKRAVLSAAVAAHSAVADRARRGQGTDRHLFALASVARRDGLPLPALFTDPAYAKV